MLTTTVDDFSYSQHTHTHKKTLDSMVSFKHFDFDLNKNLPLSSISVEGFYCLR